MNHPVAGNQHQFSTDYRLWRDGYRWVPATYSFPGGTK